MNVFEELLNHVAFGTAAALKESNYLQGCKHTLCLGGICLDNWEKWRGLLLVPSPTFHIDLQVSLQNCFSLKYTEQKKQKRKKSDSFEGKHIHEEKMCCCGDGDYLLCPSLLPQTTQLREDLQQLEEQKDKYIWKISGIHICVFLSCYAACLACQGRSSQQGSPISGFGFCVIYSSIMLMLNMLKVT